MSSIAGQSRPQRPELRLYSPDPQATADSNGSLSTAMSLTEFVDRWYMPVRQSTNRELSKQRVEDTMKLWRQITGDPPIAKIDDFTLAKWDAGLSTATYRRGRLGRPHPYKPHTIQLHQRNLQAILYALGPRLDRKRLTARLIEEPPYRPVIVTKAPRKPPFSWSDVRKIFAHVGQMTKPVLRDIPAPDWWRGWEGWLFASGQRPGTVWNLQWRFLKQDPETQCWYLDIPAEYVTKEHKEVQGLVLPQWAVDVVLSWPRSSPRIFACGVTYDTVAEWHKHLQAKAGVTLPMAPRAWKRTHIEVLKRMGLKHVQDVMQRAGDHADFTTTVQSYSGDPLDDFRRMLPCPWEIERQKRLF